MNDFSLINWKTLGLFLLMLFLLRACSNEDKNDVVENKQEVQNNYFKVIESYENLVKKEKDNPKYYRKIADMYSKIHWAIRSSFPDENEKKTVTIAYKKYKDPFLSTAEKEIQYLELALIYKMEKDDLERIFNAYRWLILDYAGEIRGNQLAKEKYDLWKKDIINLLEQYPECREVLSAKHIYRILSLYDIDQENKHYYLAKPRMYIGAPDILREISGDILTRDLNVELANKVEPGPLQFDIISALERLRESKAIEKMEKIIESKNKHMSYIVNRAIKACQMNGAK